MSERHSKAPSDQKSFIIAKGLTIHASMMGTQFYVAASSAAVFIRPVTSGASGKQMLYGQGQGLNVGDGFDFLELHNPSNLPLIVVIVSGGDDFIDKTLILQSAINPSVLYPTYSTPNTAPVVNIRDIAGTEFTDTSGTKWIALRRVTILIFNVDTGATFLVQKLGATDSSAPAVAAVYPQTSLRLDVSGDYTIQAGGGNINLVVSEIYAAVAR